MAQLYPFTDPRSVADDRPMVVVGGDGCWVADIDGNRYLDAAAGLWSASLGFSNERLIAAATAQYRALPWYHNFMGRTAGPAEDLAALLVERLPRWFDHVFFDCTGSGAVDTAVKLARYHQIARGRPEKRLFLAREGAYHGSGTMSAALSGFDYMHEGFDLPNESVVRLGSPHHRRHARPGESERAFSRRRADELDGAIREVGADRVCAMIGEPVIGSGGAIPPPDGYWEAIQEVLEAHDVLLIADEIITGFGRTGRWFATETYGLRPALITMAKQLSASYFPISAVAVRDDLYESVADQAHRIGTLGHGFTYGGHPVGAAVAAETIRIYTEMDLERHVAGRADRLRPHLERLADHPLVAEVRHVGLMAGIELQARGEVGTMGTVVGRAAQDEGVLFRIIGDTVAISPPYIITDGEIDHMMSVLDTVLAAKLTTVPR